MTIIHFEALLEELTNQLRVIFAKAEEEKREIRIDMSQAIYEKPGSGPIVEYETTGEKDIHIHIGLKGSAKRKDFDSVSGENPA